MTASDMPERLEAGDLVLVRATLDHLDAIADGVASSWREIRPWMDFAHQDYGRQDAMDWLSRAWVAWGDGRAYEFVILEDGEFRGVIGLNRLQGHQANLGFWIHSDHAGRGICTRAGRRLAREGLQTLGLGRIYLLHIVGNHGSARVAEKIGFRREGVVRNAIVAGSALRDMVQYGLIDAAEITGRSGPR